MAEIRILIVDDNPLVRSGLRIIIQNHKDWIVCAEASDGAEGVRKAVEYKPDVILLDISMPVMDGLTAAEIIRKKGTPNRKF